MDEITRKEMEEALKSILSYQMNELRKAIDELKKCIKDELIDYVLRIKLWIMRFIKIIVK